MKLKRGAVWGTLLALLTAGSVIRVWAETDADPLAAVQKQTAALKTLSANFSSIKTVSFLSEPIRTQGRLLFEKPGRVVWEVTAPFKAAVVYDGQTAARYLADAQGHWIRQTEGPDPVLGETMQQLQMWLTGQALTSEETYELTFDPGPPFKVRLVPKNPELRKFISSVEMTFEENLDVVRILVLTERSGDATQITFDQISVNQPLPANDWFSDHASQP